MPHEKGEFPISDMLCDYDASSLLKSLKITAEVDTKGPSSVHECKPKFPTTIRFNQSQLIVQLTELLARVDLDAKEKHKLNELNELNLRFNGLCEIICNHIVFEDLLGKSIPREADSFFSYGYRYTAVGRELLLEEHPKFAKGVGTITLFQLPKLKETHILNVSTMSEFLIAYFIGTYPYSLYKSDDKPQNADGSINEKLLINTLADLPVGDYAKFLAFKQSWFQFRGHSMLIKKIADDEFSFFDPNDGETQGLSAKEIVIKVQTAMKTYRATKIALLDARAFTRHLHAHGHIESDSTPAPKKS